ncbi:MAG: hypothetical protein F4X56_06615 [Gammaproteobacteria bacterium]|nr:hypothetical protein [Gammaproteobacteria bacterium]MXW06587.1 hypothetical protein [Gammaproteobacteria bacterium]MYC25571.1 hypothetical protein [Gammaproteobacteria bacterium]
MSINSLENFSEQLQQLPLQNPPKGLLLDVQNTIQRRKAFKRKLTQCSVVLSLFAATLWVVVDQQSKIQSPDNVAVNEGVEENEVAVVEPRSILPTDLDFQQQPSALTPTAIVHRITNINQEIERLPMSDTARRQELLKTKETLKENYLSIRLQQQKNAYQKVAHFN